MSAPSIRRQLMSWVLGALFLGAPVLALAAYWLTLHEIDEVLNDSLKQTALLLADRDLRGAILPGSSTGSVVPLAISDTESQLVAIARRKDGSLLFTSAPELQLRFEARPGISIQHAHDALWHVFTVVQADRVVQVAQPHGRAPRERRRVGLAAARAAGGADRVDRRSARARASAWREPLAVASDALGRRSAHSLEPLALAGVPVEVLPFVQTLNDLLRRLDAAFSAQRNFVADAAHELRSPITALQLQVQVLERSRDPAERALATAELAAGIARARRLIEQLLQLSRASVDARGDEALPGEPVRLGDLVRTVVVRWANEAERRGIDLGADAGVDAAGIVVQGDAAQLEMLLGNLVENALRYTPRGGTVDVVAGSIDGAPALRVIDDGPGIAPHERARVFDRFYRSPQAEAGAEPGSGLGLAIVKSIAERHRAVVSLHEPRGDTGLEVRVVFNATR